MESVFFDAIKIQEYYEDFITRSTYHSIGIEGSTVSYGDTYALLWNDNDFTVTYKPREIYEAINLKYALSYAIEHIDDLIDETVIKTIAGLVNKNIDEISGYRTGQALIRGAEHIPPPANQVPQAMMYLIHNSEHTTYSDAFEKAASFHIEFERIHPFSDGNGRTGRVLLNMILMKMNEIPVVIPKDERSRYFEYLASRDTGAFASWISELSSAEKDRIDMLLR